MFQSFLYFIGSFFETVHFQLLAGIKFTLRPRLYGPIHISIMFLISTIAFVFINVKKMKEWYKERIFHQKINVNLNEKQTYEEGLLHLNNQKNNVPLFDGLQITLIVGFILASLITFWSLDYAFNDSKHFYNHFMFKEFSFVYVYNIVFPLIYLIREKKMRKYFWKYVSDVYHMK